MKRYIALLIIALALTACSVTLDPTGGEAKTAPAINPSSGTAPSHNQVSALETPPVLSHKEIIRRLSEKACAMHLYWDIFETGGDVGTPDNWYALATPKGHFMLWEYQGAGPYWEAINFPTQDEAAVALLKVLDGPATSEPYKSNSLHEKKPQKPRRDIKGDPICRREKK